LTHKLYKPGVYYDQKSLISTAAAGAASGSGKTKDKHMKIKQ
jgi:hypothetical protein